MNTSPLCQQCQQPVPQGAPAGLCPECLAKVGLGSEPSVSSRRLPPEPAELAEQFPQLEIIEVLGMGGMGTVYKARQPKLDRLVALKIMPIESGWDASFADRFRREARALARLNHPGIVAVYDFGQTQDYYYFLMEHIDGMNLRQLLQGEKVSAHQALDLVMQICTALQYAHDEKIVHRDIKPENILVDTKGRVKIADFGLAKLLGNTPETNLTAPQTLMGSINYMAPEQREKPLEVDHRADIYSLGVVLYEMLTGEIPMGHFQPPSRRVQVDVRLDEVVLHALEREPERRYQKASDVKTGVETIAATMSSSGGAGKVPEKKDRRFVAVLAVLLVVIAVIAVVGRINPQQSAQIPLVRRVQSVFIQPAPDPSPLTQRWTNSLGMAFVPIAKTMAAFSIWDTRSQDFAAFAQETAYDTLWTWSWRHESGKRDGGHWIWRWTNKELSPGPLYPVSGVGWNDAHAFCRWLTQKEHKSGLLKSNLTYRLPTEAEWAVVFGTNVYPWGNQWPPPAGTGNYAGSEARDSSWPDNWAVVPGYRDDYPRTSPVGSFPPDKNGLYDISGNVWQWSEDLHGTNHSDGVLRGGSWNSGEPEELQISHRDQDQIRSRYETFGFRCVIAAASMDEPGVAQKVALKFLKVDCQADSAEKRGENAVDGNPTTFWETRWAVPHPHEIIIELVPPSSIKGFTYLPRQNDDFGAIKDYEFYVSNDGTNFGEPVNKGAFEFDRTMKSAMFHPVKCRFIKLKALSENGGGPATSAAEIGVIQSTEDDPAVIADNNELLPVIAFDAVPLPDAVNALARQAGLNIMLDFDLTNALASQVNEKWRNVTARQALLALMDNYGWQFVRKSGSPILHVVVRPAGADYSPDTPFSLSNINPSDGVSVDDGTMSPTLAFDEVPLPNAIRALASQAGLNIQIDPHALRQTNAKVTATWKNVTARQAFQALLDGHNLQLTHLPGNPILRVTSKNS